jgi:hypothetical protein
MTVPRAPSPPPWPPVAPPRPSRWPMFAFLVIALAAMALATGSWFRPLPSTKASAPPAPAYTDQQVASAKANMCTAFEKIDHDIQLADAESASSSDRTEKVAAVALTRQALDFGSQYLFAKVAGEPATKSELASAVREQANAFRELLAGYLNGAIAGDPSLQPAQKASDDATNTIRRLCK